MDPSMLGGMAEMFKNPEMMKSMEAMMENPEMQKMLNDPSMISNMMGILGNAGINLPSEPPNSNSNSTQNENTESDELPTLERAALYETGNRVVLYNLKKEAYNNLEGTIVAYNSDTERYVVLLDNDNKLGVKEANLKAVDNLEIVD